MNKLDFGIRNTKKDAESLLIRPPVFYLKINLDSDFGIECFNHWVKIVEASRAEYYIVCDKEKLKEKVINDENKDKFIPTSIEAKKLLRKIVDPHWLNAGAALFTPFLHAMENGYETFWNIDADDTVMCADAFKCAEMLNQIQEYADKSDFDCFSLDMHSSACERIYPYWTFGVCYCKLSIDYISKILSFNELFESNKLKPNDLFGNNLDEVFSILGRYSQIKVGTFYIENLYFRHNDFEIHCYKNQRFIYRNVAQFTRGFWRLTNKEIVKGLNIPERFVKFDFELSESESLTFLENNDIFNHFVGIKMYNIDFEFVTKKISDCKKKLVLFGAGKDGLRVLNALRAYEIEPFSFCDNSPRVIGTEILGVNVIDFEQLKSLSFEEEIYVLITTSTFYNEIREQLSSIPVEILNKTSEANFYIRKQFAKTFKLFDNNVFTPIYLWGDFYWFERLNNFYKDIINYDLLQDIQGFIECDKLPQRCKDLYKCITLDELPEDAFVVISTESSHFLEKQRELLRRGKINNYNFILGFELAYAFKRVLFSSTRRFQNYYNGDRCFILGNGPSLTLDDLETLRKNNEIVFVSNNFYKWFDKTALRPDFYFICDVVDVQAENFLQNDKTNFMVEIGYRSEMLKKAKNVYFFEISPWVQFDYYPHKFFSRRICLLYMRLVQLVILCYRLR